MANHPRAGQPAQQSDLINVAQLVSQYYVLTPEVGNTSHAVKFGTSGHRGSAQRHSFNEAHILAIAQAIVEVRKRMASKVRVSWVKIHTVYLNLRLSACWKF